MSADLLVTNAVLVLPDRLLTGGAVLVRGDRIAAVGPAAEVVAQAAAQARSGAAGSPPPPDVVDFTGDHLAPGFVDLHVHGGDGADYMDGTADAFRTVCRAHLRHGTTSPIATSTVASHPLVMRFLEAAVAARAEGLIPGVHLYGPWFAPDKVGCHPPKPARPPTDDDVAAYLGFGDLLLTATCAPELPGAAAFYRKAAAAGVRLNAGHSNASWTEMAAAHRLGVRHVDHLYCAMSSVVSLRPRFGTPMQASMLEFVLATPDMTTEVIADGRHLAPDLLAFVMRMIGPDRTALVTDSNRALDLPPGEYLFGPPEEGTPFRSDGEVGLTPDGKSLASGATGMDHHVRHLHRVVGVDVATAVRMASLTPARIAGLDGDRGSLAVGKRADLLRLDGDLRVRSVWQAGVRKV